jgi:hypothetical protein
LRAFPWRGRYASDVVMIQCNCGGYMTSDDICALKLAVILSSESMKTISCKPQYQELVSEIGTCFTTNLLQDARQITLYSQQGPYMVRCPLPRVDPVAPPPCGGSPARICRSPLGNSARAQASFCFFMLFLRCQLAFGTEYIVLHPSQPATRRVILETSQFCSNGE